MQCFTNKLKLPIFAILMLLLYVQDEGLFAKSTILNQENITDEEIILHSLKPDSDVLLIAFGGVGEHFGIPRFEFLKILSTFNINVLFVRDIQRAYYQYGIKKGGNITETLAILEEEIEKINPKKMLIFGNSAGGYAALLFGFLLSTKSYPISEVHAFAPIFLTDEIVDNTYRHYFNIEPEYFRLDKLFSKGFVPFAKFHIYYALDEKPDVIFASQFNQFSWFYHHIYHDGGHDLIKELKKRGELFSIIEASIHRD